MADRLTPADGVITGFGKIEGRDAGVVAEDFTVWAISGFDGAPQEGPDGGDRRSGESTTRMASGRRWSQGRGGHFRRIARGLSSP